MEAQCVVVGLGSPYLQDDQAGVVVAERLTQENLPCRIEVVHTTGFEVLDKILGFKRAIIVDACMLGHPPGTILEVGVDDLFTTQAPVNAHALSLGAILKTGFLCFPEEMPADIRIVLIEIKEITAFNRQISAQVERAIDEAVALIKRLLADMH
jgi:hydrogenase maturation protease